MDLTPWNPWQEIERVEAEMERLLGGVLEKLRRAVPGRPITFVPAMDVVEGSEDYRLYISLPGMVEEDVDLTLQGDVLIIRGEREAPYDPDQVVLHRRQWKYGYFERRVQLPGALQDDTIQATYEAGVLTIRILKRGESGPTGRVPETEAGGGSRAVPPGTVPPREGDAS